MAKAYVNQDGSYIIVHNDDYSPAPDQVEYPLPQPSLLKPTPNMAEAPEDRMFIEGATAEEIQAVVEAQKKEAEAEIDKLDLLFRNRIFGGSISGDRALEYVFTILEAAGVLGNTNIPSVQGDAKMVLQKKAEKKGGGATESSEAALALGKFLSLGAIYGETSGIRGKWKAAKNAATTIGDVKQVVENYRTEMEAYCASLGV